MFCVNIYIYVFLVFLSFFEKQLKENPTGYPQENIFHFSEFLELCYV
jgi:hypothetical protein